MWNQFLNSQHLIFQKNVSELRGIPLGKLKKPPLNKFPFTQNDSRWGITQSFPTELIEYIIIYGSESLDKACKLTRNFIQANKKIHLFLDDKENCLRLIKKLSQQFRASNEIVAETLKTKMAKVHYALQVEFMGACCETRIAEDTLDIYKKNHIDLNFTYLDGAKTILMICSDHPDSRPKAATWLIENGADITYINLSGTCTMEHLCKVPSLLPFIFRRSGFDINTRYRGGNTLLSFVVQYLTKSQHTEAQIQELYNMIEQILKKGADPEISDDYKNTPLFYIKNNPFTDYPGKRFKKLIQMYIEKK
jgi:hypothetical protein